MKHFTSAYDLTDPSAFIQEAIMSKHMPVQKYGAGKTMGLVFMNSSLRTRLSTQKAAMDLGMQVIILHLDKDSWSVEWEDGAVMNAGKTEHIREAAQMLGLYCDVIGFRCFAGLTEFEKDYAEFQLLQLMRFAQVPVISLESATRHPLQSLADMMTIQEYAVRLKRPPKVVLTWAPHVKPLPQAVANSFCEWIRFTGADCSVTNPPSYDLSSDFVKDIPVIHHQEEALCDADIVYVKNWSSFSQYGAMPVPSANWLLNEKKLSGTNNAKIMHCLPVRRNVELPDFLMEPERNLIMQQAENRYFAARHVLNNILQNTAEREITTKVNERIYEQA